MFETICSAIPADTSLPPRVAKLDTLRRVLDGTLYDNLPYQFHEERNGAGEDIPLRLRRPSVRYALCRIVVEDSVPGVAAAAAAGMTPIGFVGGSHAPGRLADDLIAAGARTVVADLRTLKSAIADLRGW